MRLFICLTCMLHLAFAAPQFVTFENGKIGVNFGGYHADAGLGGLLTGNAAHGGLSASAGTPWGPRAAAGLGGVAGGRTSGVAYAGAEANPAVGASAVLGGTAGGQGFAGSEAHSAKRVSVSSVAASHAPAASVPTSVDVRSQHVDAIQKIKPPKKYTLISNDQPIDAGANAVHSKTVSKSVYKSVGPVGPVGPLGPFVPLPAAAHSGAESGSSSVHVHSGGGLVGNALQIPIGILRSLQETLGGLNAEKTVSYQKSG